MKKMIVKTANKKSSTEKSAKKNSNKYLICVGKNF
jgi:hypothetical protein